MRVLGISAFYHDSATALVEDGRVVAAAQEERFSRRKHDARFPAESVRFCLKQAGVSLQEIDFVAFYDKPFLKFERLLETYLAFAPNGFKSFGVAMPVWLREKLFLKNLLRRELRTFDNNFDWKNRLLFAEHHQSHAASAFFPSPFGEAVVLTMDGVGEWATSSVSMGSGHSLRITKDISFPHSLGLLYSAFTYYTGFKVNSGEYKLMGLAPYGEPKYVQAILDNLVDIKPDGSFRLDQSYFDYCAGLKMTNGKFDALFGAAPRSPDEPIEQRHMDLAASIQAVTEEIVVRITRSLSLETGARNLCLAGGVALNCVANGRMLREGRFKGVWIQPAAGDAGGALGAAFSAYHLHQERLREVPEGLDAMAGSYLGPSFSQQEVASKLREAGGRFSVLDEEALICRTAADIAEGKAVGWFQGRMEFGPRALGARSILGDARSPTMQRILNLKVKHRESFRPFAPSVLREDAADWFDLDEDSPYMLFVAPVTSSRRLETSERERELFGIEQLNVIRSQIPAVTHVDHSARIQTVHKDTNPIYHSLLLRLKATTGCPVVVNTSFNVRGEPIVCTPEDAFRCFMGTGIDALAIGNCYLRKEEQNPALGTDSSNAFEPD